ncbi:hypothetical protein [Actinotalea sp. C106]|uniref:hypothetical protein n=1 Tax=Actinotalea sp. C106 TaxID=2908644 RepID=UPI0020290FFA|nr:hypothetical protein [Actinotalea sp. C106]
MPFPQPTLPSVDDRPVTRPDVWSIPATGIPWSGEPGDPGPDRHDVVALFRGRESADGRVPHEVVVEVTRELWEYEWVCRFFHLQVAEAARDVVGAVLPSYEVRDAVDITGLFSKRWQGCPEQACEGA